MGKEEVNKRSAYLVNSGCKWRQLSHDFMLYTTVLNFYRKAVREELWEKILKMLVQKTREADSRSKNSIYALIDSQSVKTVYNSEKRGFDGEKTKGRKWHIVTDTMGNIIAVNVYKANQHDTKGDIFIFEKALFLYTSIKACCADRGYRGTFKNIFETFRNIRIDISRQIKPKFKILPKR